MEIHGVSMEFHGMPCSSTVVHAVMPWNSMDCPWSSMELHRVRLSIDGVAWNVMEFHGVSMKFDIHSLQFVMRIHRNALIKQLINLLTTCSSLHFLLERKIENILKAQIVRKLKLHRQC